jgi:long-chain fatty acid transport protein
MKRASTITLLLGFAALSTGTACADDYHYVNMLIGDRASGLGGAYTAVADDATGLFYNPAGVVYARGGNLSASVNAFHVTRSSYKDVLGSGDWNRESSSLLPNFFGVIQPLGKGMAGFSYAVTDSVQENLDQVFHNQPAWVDRYIINLNNDDTTYKFGPSYAAEIRPGLSLGLTAYAHFRTTRINMQQVLTGIHATNSSGDPLSYEWSSSYYQNQESGIEPILGLMWTPAERVTLGASVRKVTVLDSTVRVQSTCASDYPASSCTSGGSPSTTPLSPLVTEVSDQREYPTQATLGIAWFPSETLLWSADVNWYEATEDDVRGERPATWNASAGVEYYVSPTWALRGGLYTSNANTPELDEAKTNQNEHVDLLGLSASLSRFTRNSSITLGIALASGEGKAQIVSGGTVQDETIFTATAFLSTSYSY